jgi:hypothetical protein
MWYCSLRNFFPDIFPSDEYLASHGRLNPQYEISFVGYGTVCAKIEFNSTYLYPASHSIEHFFMTVQEYSIVYRGVQKL